MFKKTKIFLLLLFFMNLESDQELIKSKIASILPPDVTIEKIEQSSIDGLFKVFYGDIQPIYVTANGSHFIYGDMFQINKDGITNITEIDINKKRAQVLSQIPKRELISFVSKNEKFSVLVFTDVDCGYCRKLHSQIEDYNKLGISINYLAFPRSGLGTESFSKMVGAWCSKNKRDSISKLKNDENIEINFCDSQPVSNHFVIGQKIGVDGTPAIIMPNGKLLPGYLSPSELFERLKG